MIDTLVLYVSRKVQEQIRRDSEAGRTQIRGSSGLSVTAQAAALEVLEKDGFNQVKAEVGEVMILDGSRPCIIVWNMIDSAGRVVRQGDSRSFFIPSL